MRCSILSIVLMLSGCSAHVVSSATDAGVPPDPTDAAVPEVDAGAPPDVVDAGPPPPPEVPFPIPDWSTGAPEDHGLDRAKLDEAAAIAEQNDSHCLLVIRHGTLVYERYFAGADATQRHSSWSIAKSYASTLVGIAIDRGDIRSLDDRVSDYVPEWRGTEHEAITVRNLVSMTSGLEWSAFGDYVSMATFAPDQTEYALDLSQGETPGSSWVYHNGGVQMLEPLFENATGMTIEAYAQQHLWSRIGMSASWAHDDSGQPTVYANVLATCRDHARLGYLYLHRGRWADEQVISESWVSQALTPSQEYNRAYGFLFWLNGDAPAMDAMMDPMPGWIVPFAPPDLFAARGFGNQFIDVIPSLDLIVVRFGTDPFTTFDLGRLTTDARFERHDQILRPILDGLSEGGE